MCLILLFQPMTIDTSTTAFRDITLLFDSLDVPRLDMRKLKELFEIQPVGMDTPDLSVIIYPPLSLIIQLGDNRIRLSHQAVTDRVDALELWSIAITARKVASRHNLTAYGFNYDIIAQVDPPLWAAVTEKWFIADVGALAKIARGQIVGFTPRLKYVRDDVNYDLMLEQPEMGTMKAHLNVHFAADRLPPSSVLRKRFLAEYDEFRELIGRIVGGS